MNELTAKQEHEIKDFAQMYNTWRPKLIAYAQIFLKKEEDAKDIVNSLFYILLESQKWKEIIESPGSYLYTSVYNNSLKFLELGGQKYTRSIEDNEEFSEVDESDLLFKITKEQDRIAIRKAVYALPNIYREAIILRYYKGLSNKEIAKILDVKDKALESRILRGLAMLKETLKFLRS